MGEAKRRKKLQKDLIGIWCCGFVPLYLLFTGFADFSGISGWKTWTFYALAAVLAALAVLLSVFCLNIDNLAYTASATAHRATLSFATRLVERVESTPGYRSGMEVVIVGGFPEAPYHSGVAAFDLVDAPADSVLSRPSHGTSLRVGRRMMTISSSVWWSVLIPAQKWAISPFPSCLN